MSLTDNISRLLSLIVPLTRLFAAWIISIKALASLFKSFFCLRASFCVNLSLIGINLCSPKIILCLIENQPVPHPRKLSLHQFHKPIHAFNIWSRSTEEVISSTRVVIVTMATGALDFLMAKVGCSTQFRISAKAIGS